MLVGVDIGGTFTDLALSVGGHLKIYKLLSSPHNPAEAMLAGLEAIVPEGLMAITQVAHGSTVATNAILERKGAKTALITTQGFRDILAIGRQNRPVLYALHPTLPTSLIPRELCYEVPERLDHTGAVLTPLDMSELDRVLDDITTKKVESVAVCFLYSFVNPKHEREVRMRITERGLLDSQQIALSSDVLPEFREYERTSTVVLEAYVRPVMIRYIEQLERQLPASTTLRVMKSDGGVTSAARIKRQAIQTALSGPAAGVIGAFHIAKLAGFSQIITLDIGGTSTDVALCPDELVRRAESEIDGLPLRIRLLDIETIGAGGGSIARLDAGGALRVGPESAGAEPGPLVYGRGGTQITVSDANAVLGRLDTQHFLGGRMALDIPTAQGAIERLAQAMGMSVEAAAGGIIDVANVNIDRALRRVSIARGHDPRNFTLVAFGGAGPLHACAVAERLDIPRVLIPRYPGVLCAFGLLVADVVVEHHRSVMQTADAHTIARLRALQGELLALARTDLAQEGIPEDRRLFNGLLDMRYRGQAYELTIPFKGNVVKVFHAAHEAAYGHAMPERQIEIVNLRLQGVGIVDKALMTAETVTENAASTAWLGEKTLLDGTRTALYDRELLTPGARFDGSALVFQLDSTVFVPDGWSARVDGYRNLILERA